MKPTTLLVTGIILLGTLTCWSQRPRSDYQYLTDTANAIYDLATRSMDLKPEEVAEITARACKTLDRLLGDKNFINDVYRMEKSAAKDTEYHNRMRRDLDYFIESFAKPEAGVLKNAGLSEEAIKQMLWSAAYLHDSLDTKPDSKRILDALDRLRKDICSAARTLTKDQNDERTKTSRKKRITKWALGLGGAAMIAADTVAEVPSGGLAMASFTLGGTMVGAAIAVE